VGAMDDTAGSGSKDLEATLKAIYGEASIQAQLDAANIPETAKTPGPGHYFGPGNAGFSSFGVQKFAKCPSAPEWGMPRTGWDQWRGVRISKGHEKALKGSCSPPPDTYNYNLDTLDGVSTKIGTSERPDLTRSLGIDPAGSPGPAYKLKDPWDRQPCHADNKEMQGHFGKADRFAVKREKFKNLEYTRKDVAVQSHTGKSFSVGRSAYDKVIRPGWEKEGQCKLSPGVGPPMRKNIKKESRSVPFLKADRFQGGDYATGSPGPGAYDRGEGCIGSERIAGTGRPSPTKERLGTFGKRPVKPRFCPHLASLTGKHGGWGYF